MSVCLSVKFKFIELLTQLKINRVRAIFVGQGTTKSHNPRIFKSQYLSECLRYEPDFLHVIINFIDFKITFSNMGSNGAPSLISGRWRKLPPLGFSSESETSPLIGLKFPKIS